MDDTVMDSLSLDSDFTRDDPSRKAMKEPLSEYVKGYHINLATEGLLTINITSSHSTVYTENLLSYSKTNFGVNVTNF